ncbi:MAG TPA: hypothetical protein VFH29_00230, partial [Anaerolineales bacterium]|nr:hypothetical protein [Anaerolineales bacterium]
DPGLPATFVTDPPGSSTDTLAPSTQKVLGIRAAPSLADAVIGARRVWFVLFDRSNDEYVNAGYLRHAHLTELLEKYRLAETRSWDGITVYLFTTSPVQ